MLPFMRSKNKSHTYTITGFGGINPSYSKKVSELKSAVNMNSEKYPALCSDPSLKVELMNTLHTCGSGFYDRLYTIRHSSSEQGQVFICSDDLQTLIASYSSSEERDALRKMAFMGNKLLVIPENIIYHTDTDTVEKGNVTQAITYESSKEKFNLESKTDDTPPMPDNIWYSAELTSKSIKSISATYLYSSTGYRFYHFAPYDNFEKNDVVHIKMEVKPIDVDRDDAYYEYLDKMKNGIYAKIKDTVKVTHDTPNGKITETIELVFDDINLDNGYDEVVVKNITIEKAIPDFVDICTFENRIWGVTKDTIHSSKLGDPSEWNDFSVDSYGTLPSSCFKTGVETDRNFTAITAYNGNIIAFKEDCMHKIYGSQPDEYTITTIECCGVEDGARETLAVVGGTLFYKGRDGIYAYNGGLPRLISRELSLENTKALFGGGDDRYYYVSIIKDNTECIYIYDTYYGLWHTKNIDKHICGFAKADDTIRVITDNHIYKKGSSYNDMWSFSLDFGTKEFTSKHISKVSMRYSLSQNSACNLTISNKHGSFLAASLSQSGDNLICSVRIPVTCAEDFALTVRGMGEFCLSSLTVEYSETGIND